MNHRSVWASLALTVVTNLVGCMDISPPVNVENSTDGVLHSISLPFSRAIYGVGDTDSIPVYAIQITGDTFQLSPDSLSWKLFPVNSSLHVDSLGRLTAVSTSSSIASTGVSLIVSYTQGEVTKADTAKIFITTNSYDIKTFKMRMKDSSRGGAMATSMFIPGLLQPSDFPQLDLEVKDIEDNSPPQMNFANHFTRFMTSAETGRRFSGLGLINIRSISAYPTNLYVQSSALIGEYWVGLETYMYGNHLRDSVRFTQMASAEIFYGAAYVGGVATVSASRVVVQPCALVVFRNLLSDTVVIELPPSDYECDGNISPMERINVPPGTPIKPIKLRYLGYNVGTEKEWKVYLGVNSQTVIARGIIRARLDDE